MLLLWGPHSENHYISSAFSVSSVYSWVKLIYSACLVLGAYGHHTFNVWDRKHAEPNSPEYANSINFYTLYFLGKHLIYT